MPKTKEFTDWFKKAQDDLKIVQIVLKEKAPYWVACFHAQQAVEKSLKAAQIYFLNDFQKEHDLVLLLSSLKEKIKIESIYSECLKLSGFYVTTRYPGIKELEITLKDAVVAEKAAEKVINFIKNQIK
ncbi:MAG: HEPN domain protein [Berkelbacteria bacterium GW2011_GWA1_36_9]|uniref:HEPN domain protein n=1 Tax=Berkelbacteria bacterium GW2011_GWA1_36_9 TaxID=1618331 RepID=A0A0G0IRQ5_9BACT|nr:MAG: HEPN domain protein [Berkelbacteria bacterium GW2011_GWA1_36_9]